MCTRPRKVIVQSRTFGVRRVIDAPCGKCVECLKQRQNDWKLRICHECGYHDRVYFFTLTYRESMLPCSVCCGDVVGEVYGIFRKPQALEIAGSLDMDVKSTAYVKDVQDFIKRLRTDYERKYGKLDLKYFICAEYGPNPRGTKRPHYHGILMTNAEYNQLLPYFNSWRDDYGRFDFVEVGIDREDKSSVANYVSKYCAKGCFESRAEDIDHGHISRAFSLMSKNIGSRWLDNHASDFLSRVPSIVKVSGDWTVDMIDNFYNVSSSNGYVSSDLGKWIGTDKEHPIWKEIDNLLDNMRIWDGSNHSYKMPRYYFDRLFSVKKIFTNYETTDVPSLVLAVDCVPDTNRHLAYSFFPSAITFKVKERKDVRYVRENFLSCAIAYRLFLRSLAQYSEDIRKFGKSLFYTDENGVFHSRYEDSKRAAAKAREQVASQKLSNFYQSNMWKNPELDFDSSDFEYQLFTNNY